MDDLISRQSAIDVIEAGRLTKLIDAEIAVNGLKALSSAQPGIIRCGQCKYAEVADAEDSQDGYTCQFHRGSIWFSGSYCSWAERRHDG